MIKFVFGVLPAFVTYTDAIQEGSGGQAVRCVVSIRPKYANDRGILEHELQHVRQWYETLMFHSILYICSRTYRQWSEAQAYAVQMRFPDSTGVPMTLQGAAERLAGKPYGLSLSIEQAKAAIVACG